MKKVKHIWKYLTSPTYRFWVDFCTRQDNLDRNRKEIEYALALQAFPMFELNENKVIKVKEAEK